MASLGEFHHVEEGPTTASKIIAAIVIAFVIAGVAVYAAESGMLNSSSAQTSQSYPRGL